MKTNPSTHGTRTGNDVTETIIVTGRPQEILAHIEHIHKPTRDDTKFVTVKAKQYMSTQQRRNEGRTAGHEGLKPG